jgi:hypothetical protein
MCIGHPASSSVLPFPFGANLDFFKRFRSPPLPPRAPGSPACFFPPDLLGPVEYGSRNLWLSHRIAVGSGDTLRVRFEKSVAQPRQALRVSMLGKRDKLRINGHEGRRFVLWADTSPQEVVVDVMKAAKGAQLVVSNAWEDAAHGTTLYGLNWTAIDVQPLPDGSTRLDCSDGYGTSPSFGDLIVVVSVERASSALPG